MACVSREREAAEMKFELYESNRLNFLRDFIAERSLEIVLRPPPPPLPHFEGVKKEEGEEQLRIL